MRIFYISIIIVLYWVGVIAFCLFNSSHIAIISFLTLLCPAFLPAHKSLNLSPNEVISLGISIVLDVFFNPFPFFVLTFGTAPFCLSSSSTF